MATYKLTPAAEEDLEGIWRYTLGRWGLDQAVFYIDGLTDAFEFLAENPLACRERIELDQPVRIHPHGRHIIVYLIDGKDITVIRVLHENMDMDAQLGD